MTHEFVSQPIKPNFFSNLENTERLEKKLEYVEETKPDISSFLNAPEYTRYQVEGVLKKLATINKDIQTQHRQELKKHVDKQEHRRYTSLIEKLVIDRFNKWFPGFWATLASDFDNISGGVDIVITEKGNSRVGVGVDLTSAFDIPYLTKKMNRDWDDENINKTTKISFYEDEKGRKHPVSAMRFVVGILKPDAGKLAEDCMGEGKEIFEDNFFKYLMIMQMDEQLERWLDYCFENESDPNTAEKNTQCIAMEKFLNRLKKSVDYDTAIKKLAFQKYISKSTALQVAKILRDY